MIGRHEGRGAVPLFVAGQLPEAQAQPVSVLARFGEWRTWLSFAVAVGILVLATRKAGIDWASTMNTLGAANPALVALAFLVYYASFPLRTERWRRLMCNANDPALRPAIAAFPLPRLTGILYLSFFANVIVPLKLGDVYRAYLARRWLGTSLSRTVGALLAERVLDLVVLFPLLVCSAVLAFRDRLFTSNDDLVRTALLGGFALALLAAVLLVVICAMGERALGVLPVQGRAAFARFRQGTMASFGQGRLALVAQTGVIWLMEGGRVACVLWALGLLGAGKLGIGAAIFLALGSSVLTTFPFTPGGLGIVDTFFAAGLVLLGVPGGKPTAVAVVVVDRLISYVSIAVIGFAVYLLTDVARPGSNVPAQDRVVA